MQKNLSIYLAFFSHFRKCLTNFSVSNSTLITVFILDVASPKGGFRQVLSLTTKNLNLKTNNNNNGAKNYRVS